MSDFLLGALIGFVVTGGPIILVRLILDLVFDR